VSYTILFVDHDPERNERIRESLERAGHRIVLVCGADEALTALDEERPNLVVIDSELRDKPAAELCRGLKETAHGAETPIVVISGEYDSEQEAVAELAQSGCDLLIEKPVTEERLVDLCRQLLDGDPTVDQEATSDEVPLVAVSEQENNDSEAADDESPIASEQKNDDRDAADDESPARAQQEQDEPDQQETAATGDENLPLAEIDELGEGDGDASSAESKQAAAEKGSDASMPQAPAADDIDDDGLLDGQAVQSAMGKLDSILDESDGAPDSDEATARARRASARGDFSELLDEVNVDHPPKHARDRALAAPSPPEETPAEEPVAETAKADSAEEATAEQAVEAAMLRAFDARPPEDEGRDIEDHLDTLFSGGSDRVEPTAEASPSTGVPATSVQTDHDDEPKTPAEPFDVASRKLTQPMPLHSQSTKPAAVREKTVAESKPPAVGVPGVVPRKTGPRPPVPAPAARELFDPVDTVLPLPLERQRRGESRAKVWIYGVAALIVLIAAAAILLRGRDSTSIPATVDPLVAEATPTETTLGPGPLGDAVAESPDPAATPVGTERTTTATQGRDPVPQKTAAEARPDSARETARPSAAKPERKPRPTVTETKPAPEPPKPAAKPASAEPRAISPTEPAPSENAKAERPPAAGATTGSSTEEPPVAAKTSIEKTSAESAAVSSDPSPIETDPIGSTVETSAESTAGAATGEPEPATAPVAAETPAATEPATPVEDVDEPIVLSRVEPEVPPKALKQRKRATVVLKVLVNERGGIARVLVERGIPGSELEAAAISAVLRWKFQPATRNGEPIRAWTKATFRFGR
jgi:protein TonB